MLTSSHTGILTGTNCPKSSYRLTTALAFALLLGSGEYAQAQDRNENDAVAATSAESLDRKGGNFGDIIVTATRSDQRLSRVAVSVTAYDQDKLDEEGVRAIDDVARLTPGISFKRSGLVGSSQIAIRGISSAVGAATTGIYIDDTPVQARAINILAANPYPEIFDLARIEVLRGPHAACANGATIASGV